MRLSCLLACTLFSAILATDAQGGLVFYTSQTAFDAASTGLQTDTFAGIVPNTGFNYYSSGSYTSSTGTNYAIDRSTSNGNLFIVGPDYNGNSDPYPVITSQASTTLNNNLTVTFAHPVTAVAFDYDSLGPATLTFTLSSGDQFSESSPGGPTPRTFAFIGFTSTSAITSVAVSDANLVTSVGFDLTNVSFGAAVPEPPSIVLVSFAIFIGFMVRRHLIA